MDNYNVNRKVVNFKDFSGETEKEELQKVRRSTKPNSEDQQHVGNSRFKFNKVTRKMDDLSPEMIDDKIDAIEELEETNENLTTYMTYASFNFKKLAKEYLDSDEAEDSSYSRSEIDAIKDFAKFLDKKKTDFKSK